MALVHIYARACSCDCSCKSREYAIIDMPLMNIIIITNLFSTPVVNACHSYIYLVYTTNAYMLKLNTPTQPCIPWIMYGLAIQTALIYKAMLTSSLGYSLSSEIYFGGEVFLGLQERLNV